MTEGERKESVCCVGIPAHPTCHISSVNLCSFLEVMYKLLSFVVWDASFGDVVLSGAGALEGEGRIGEFCDEIRVKLPLFSFA